MDDLAQPPIGDVCIPGKRTYLRPVELEDAPLLRYLMNEPAVTASFVGFNVPVSSEDQARWTATARLEPNGPWHLSIVERASLRAVGLASFTDIDWRNGSARTAVKLHPDFHGRGLAIDAGLARTAWAFFCAGLRRLEAQVVDFNDASQRLIERAGYRLEGRRREAIYRDGRWCDVLVYGLLRSEAEEMPEFAEYRNLVVPVSTTPVSRS